MLSILFTVNNLFTSLSIACPRMSSLFFKHILIKTWQIDLLGYPSRLLMWLFSLHLSQIEHCGYVSIIGVTTIRLSRTNIYLPWLASLSIGFAKPNNSSNQILLKKIIGYVLKKETSGRPCFGYVTAITSIASYHQDLPTLPLLFNLISTNVELKSQISSVLCI